MIYIAWFVFAVENLLILNKIQNDWQIISVYGEIDSNIHRHKSTMNS